MLKKIEAIIRTEREYEVVEALRKLNLGGFSLFSGKGRGKGPREIKPGLGRYIERYAQIEQLIVVVEDSRVDEVVSAIVDSAHTGGLGDGKIFIYPVEEIVDISSKKRGTDYL